MRQSRYVNLMFLSVWLAVPLSAQDVTPAVTGTGQTNHLAIWKNTTTLGSSGIVAAAGNIGIGTTTPAAKLEVNGDMLIDGNLNLVGSILASGAGQLIWAPNNGSGNFSAGLGALPSTTTGDTNTAVGDGALAIDTSGYGNTAIGQAALSANTGGNLNTAVGIGAMASNTFGGQNVAVGHNALNGNTLGNANTAAGDNALHFNTTGTANVAVGIYAMEQNGSGNNNTATGYGALGSLTTGSNNTAVGYQAGAAVTTTSNNIEIGAGGTPADNGVIRIGSPGAQTTAFIAGIRGVATGSNNAIPVVIDSNGQLGTLSSSRRFKEDIQDMGGASSGLMRLRPVTFRYKKAYDDGSKPVQYGLIAEEVAEVYPDLVSTSVDGQVESVKYQFLTPMLLNEIQKQREYIQSLEQRLARVEAALGASQVATSAR